MVDVLQHQIEYYRARAQEYDEWFYRQGYYDRGETFNERWKNEAHIVREQLLDTAPKSHILEMACGTGIWTQELVKIADQITALDASPEMIAINRAKVQSDKVTYHQVDLFQWQADQQYDMIFFGFWLSHVPPAKLSPFLQTVYSALKPDGRLFFVDSRQSSSSTSTQQNITTRDNKQKRILNDGREFEIIKIYYDPADLSDRLTQHGFHAPVQVTPTYFIYTDGKKA